MTEKIRVAILFGGRSVEHDVSILTGLQCLEALDPVKYEGIPVYVDATGGWWTGIGLRDRKNYPLVKNQEALVKNGKLQPVRIDAHSANSGIGKLLFDKKSLFGQQIQAIEFDIALPAIHGSNGEDGSLQGLFSFAGIPFTGSRCLGSGLTMDKLAAKTMAQQAGVKSLPALHLHRPKNTSFLDASDIAPLISKNLGGYDFPYIVKPRHLGSSVGVQKVDHMDQLVGALATAFRLDTSVLVEPCVQPLVEYNVAVRRDEDGSVQTSAIEKPTSKAALLDFKNKYLSGGDPGAPKTGDAPSDGMASLNRELHPELSQNQENFIRNTAVKLFDLFDLAGSVRIDFLSNSQTGEIWFNEVNTIPGSFAYFLWEAAEPELSFLALTDHMITEGRKLSSESRALTDQRAGGATIFKED